MYQYFKSFKTVMIAFVTALWSLTAGAQNVSNIRVQPMEHIVVIMYDLAARSDIEVHVSLDGGTTYQGPLQHVTGAVGKGIDPEKDRVVVWNALDEFGAMDNPNTVIKVVSTNEAGAPKEAASIPVKDGALISKGRTVYQLNREMSETEFERFLDLKLYKGMDKMMNELSRGNVQFMMDMYQGMSKIPH